MGDLPSSPIDWNTLISDDVLTQVISAKSALSLDITKKYKSLVETSLSYSHIYPNISPTESLPQIPRSASGYDIAYL